MTNTATNQYNPDYVIHPGEILEETLEARNIKKSTFAKKCGISAKTVSLIIHGQASITSEMAIKFERVLGNSASLWINLNTDYELMMARKADQLKLKSALAWVKNFPVKKLVEYGLLPKKQSQLDTLSNLLQFFGVGNIEAWNKYYQHQNLTYRKSPTFKGNLHSIAAWVRIGEKLANPIDCSPFSKARFKKTLNLIRKITTETSDFQEKITKLCQKAGIALVFVPELPKAHISGVTKWLTPDKAMIILSLRHKVEDHLWFTFFHEAAHILLHGKTEVFIDDQSQSKSEKEQEADNFASNILIPPKQLEQYLLKKRITQATICEFAQEIDISPGVLVGRLQHDKHIPFNRFNLLKRKFNFAPQCKSCMTN